MWLRVRILESNFHKLDLGLETYYLYDFEKGIKPLCLNLMCEITALTYNKCKPCLTHNKHYMSITFYYHYDNKALKIEDTAILGNSKSDRIWKIIEFSWWTIIIYYWGQNNSLYRNSKRFWLHNLLFCGSFLLFSYSEALILIWTQFLPIFNSEKSSEKCGCIKAGSM